MLKKIILPNVFIILVFCLVSWSSFANPDLSQGAELRADQFFSFELAAGDQLIHDGPYQKLAIEGPATVEWYWEDGALFMKSSMGEAKVRPLEAFPREEMTEERIVRARARYDNVPFIDDYLNNNPAPSNLEWVEGYQAWLTASTTFSDDLRTIFKNDKRDILLVAEELADQANGHKLIVPGSVRIELGNDGNQVDLWMVMKGMPAYPDGTPDEMILILNKNRKEPAPRPSRISREEALSFHHGINTLFESSKGPLVVKLGKGLSISTSEGRK